MELTSSSDILRVAKNGSKFFVNGEKMYFIRWDTGGCYLYNNKFSSHPDHDDGKYVRYPASNTFDSYRALMYNVEELIEVLKSGKFEIS